MLQYSKRQQPFASLRDAADLTVSTKRVEPFGATVTSPSTGQGLHDTIQAEHTGAKGETMDSFPSAQRGIDAGGSSGHLAPGADGGASSGVTTALAAGGNVPNGTQVDPAMEGTEATGTSVPLGGGRLSLSLIHI